MSDVKLLRDLRRRIDHGEALPTGRDEYSQYAQALEAAAFALEERSKLLKMFCITGFGIDGDDAWVEAEGPEAAKRLLLETLTNQGIECEKPIETWEALEASHPVLVVRWVD
jgi:hypothetical protein